jgi:hypothetical protein
VRMWVRTPHDGALILKYLDPYVLSTKFRKFFDPSMGKYSKSAASSTCSILFVANLTTLSVLRIYGVKLYYDGRNGQDMQGSGPQPNKGIILHSHGGTEETMENFSHNSWCPGQYSNWAPSTGLQCYL